MLSADYGVERPGSFQMPLRSRMTSYLGTAVLPVPRYLSTAYRYGRTFPPLYLGSFYSCTAVLAVLNLVLVQLRTKFSTKFSIQL